VLRISQFPLVDMEPIAANMKGKEAVMLRNVRKEFNANNSLKVAVDGLSVTLYEDHITALLGHNGAGNISFPFLFYHPRPLPAFVPHHRVINNMLCFIVAYTIRFRENNDNIYVDR
jgi:hypothetical protein